MIKSFKVILALAVIMLVVIPAAGCGKSGNVVATVNGEKITQKQLDEMVSEMKKYYSAQGLTFDESKDAEMVKTLNTMTLEQLITQTILMQEAKKLGVQVTKEDVNKEIDKYKEQMTEEKFKEYLKKNELSESRLKEMVEKDLYLLGLQNKLLEDVKPATEEQARDYYEKNKKEFVTRESYQVRHILAMTDGKEGDKGKIDLEAKTKILTILEELKQGQDFAEIAKTKSEDPGTAPEGGLLSFSPGDVVPEFEAAAKALKPGGMTMEPVKTSYGYHLVKLEKITPEKQKTFEEVKAGIIERLTEEAKQDKIDKFLEEAKKNAQVVNNLDKPEEKKPEEEKKTEKKE
ncbi:MAG: SurA N-terminal domain-containing protein [Bacillota bacterium]